MTRGGSHAASARCRVRSWLSGTNSHDRLHWRPRGGRVSALSATFKESEARWSAPVRRRARVGVRSNPA
jgi:hypothetical protein